MDLTIDEMFKYAILIFLVVAIIVIVIKVAPNFLDLAGNFGSLKGKLL
jgi:hypothetical protein